MLPNTGGGSISLTCPARDCDARLRIVEILGTYQVQRDDDGWTRGEIYEQALGCCTEDHGPFIGDRFIERRDDRWRDWHRESQTATKGSASAESKSFLSGKTKKNRNRSRLTNTPKLPAGGGIERHIVGICQCGGEVRYDAGLDARVCTLECGDDPTLVFQHGQRGPLGGVPA